MKKFKYFISDIIVKITSILLPSKIMRNKKYFQIWESNGYHITPVHHYEPIPDSRDFPPDIFERESPLSGINLFENDQILLLNDFSSKYKEEYSDFSFSKSSVEKDFYFGNGVFETVDAEILYCMIRKNKPNRIIEIGSGFSTLISAKAIKKNKIEDSRYSCELICIEPYPNDWLCNIPEVKKIIKSPVEKLSLDTFKILEQNDILFIDSTHIIKIYNDVCFEYLEILPILNNGVIVHIHDIVLPNLYCVYWYNLKMFWTEQYLLQAFLTGNSSFKVLWAANFMHLKHSLELAQAFPSYLWFKNHKDLVKHLEGHKSFWVQRISSM